MDSPSPRAFRSLPSRKGNVTVESLAGTGGTEQRVREDRTEHGIGRFRSQGSARIPAPSPHCSPGFKGIHWHRHEASSTAARARCTANPSWKDASTCPSSLPRKQASTNLRIMMGRQWAWPSEACSGNGMTSQDCRAGGDTINTSTEPLLNDAFNTPFDPTTSIYALSPEQGVARLANNCPRTPLPQTNQAEAISSVPTRANPPVPVSTRSRGINIVKPVTAWIGPSTYPTRSNRWEPTS